MIISLSEDQLKEFGINIVRETLAQVEKDASTKGNEQPLTMKEASEFLKIALPTLYGLTARNAIEFMKVSKRIYFTRQALQDYLAKGTKKTRSQLADSAHTFLKP